VLNLDLGIELPVVSAGPFNFGSVGDSKSQYIPHVPTSKQAAFVESDLLEVLYGGAAGGGKSDAMLMAALRFIDQKDYSALLLRRTYADLSLPGALMDRAEEWLVNTDAHWSDKEKTWTFPSGATLTFGYLENERQKYRYQGAEFQFIGFDELTQFEETQYKYLFSRLRRLKGSDIPIRMRAASNPGGLGHNWVYRRFIVEAENESRQFIPAGLSDNPHVDADEYTRSLQELDEITRRQLLDGEWVADEAGRPFKSEWWDNKNRYSIHDTRQSNTVIGRWIFFDTAFKSGATNDYSVGSVIELLPDYRIRLRHVWRDKIDSAFLPDKIEEMAYQWNHDEKLQGIVIEDKGSGTTAIQTMRRTSPAWMAGMVFEFTPYGKKSYRARVSTIHCVRGCVLLPHPDETLGWYKDTIDATDGELFLFEDDESHEYDDFADTFTMAIIYLENYITQGYHARMATNAAQK